MRVLIVDDEPLVSDFLKILLSDYKDVEVAAAFSCPLEALRYVEKQPVDVAFLDVRMPKMNGLQLAENLYKILPNIDIVFISGYREYGADAYELEALDYLVKPILPEKLARTINKLRARALGREKRQPPATNITYFGRFAIERYGKELEFRGAIVLQLVAFLAHCGNYVDKYDIIDALWPDGVVDDAADKRLKNVIFRLRKQLREYGFGKIVSNKSDGSYKLELGECQSDRDRLIKLTANNGRAATHSVRIKELYKSGYLADHNWEWAHEATAWWHDRVNLYVID